MKRSEVNAAIELAKQDLDAIGCKLARFDFWTTDDWHHKGSECDAIRQCVLCWDVTDFGHTRFDEVGCTLFTSRNGESCATFRKHYVEILILDLEDQKSPLHYPALVSA
jgi:D-lyxose ketol-isomerase